MSCVACGTELFETSRFCHRCGAPQSVRCGTCQADNAPASRFCSQCGSPIKAPLPATETTNAQSLERRSVSVMFCDLVGSTERSTHMDPEDLREVIAAYHSLIGEAVAPFDGFIAQYLGDGALVYFGYPQAHDNDAERAVRSALSIVEGVAALRPHGQLLEVRVGVATGPVVVGDIVGAGREKGAIGETPNLAARLQALAAPNTVVVAPSTRLVAGGLFEYASLGSHTLKGFGEAIEAWQALAPSSKGRFSAMRASEGPIAGRRAELGQLRAILDTCKNDGAGRAVFLRGEAGIGKSRLLEEFLALARKEGFACHLGLVLDFGAGAARNAISLLARDVLCLAANATPEALGAATELAVASGLVEGRDAVFLNELIGAPQGELRTAQEAMDAATRDAGSRQTFAELLASASRRQPRVVAIEDLHWADGFTLAHLAALASRVASVPAILVMTSRHDSDPLDVAWRAKAGAAPLTTIDLGPLSSKEASLLAKSLLGANAALIERYVERASGNPLFLEQLVRNTAEGTGLDVPSSVQGLVQARLDRLHQQDKAALQTASVLGQRFLGAAFANIFGQAGYPAERLLEHFMIEKQGEEFVFSHALVREAIYDSLLKSARRELHRRAAQWFLGRDGGLRAEHLDRAGDAAAPLAYLEAAQFAYVNLRHELARGMAQRGLALALQRTERFLLANLGGEILHDLGDMPASLKSFEAALAAADSDAERARALIGCARVKRVTEDLDGAFADLQRAEQVVVRDGLKEEEARLRFLRGNLYFPKGDLDACLGEHRRSLELARELGLPEQQAAALGGLGDAEYARGRMISAHSLLGECVRLSRRNGFGRTEVANDAQIAHTMLYLGPQHAALAHARAAAAAASRIGHLRAELNALLAAMFALAELEEWQACETELERAEALVVRLGARRFEQNCLLARGRIANARGRGGEAMEALSRAAEIARQMGMGFLGPIICGALAAATNDAGDRRAALAEGEAVIARGCVGHNQLIFYPMAIDVALDLSDCDSAERYAAALEALAPDEPTPWSVYFIARARTLAAVVRKGSAGGEAAQSLLKEGQRLGCVASLRSLWRALSWGGEISSPSAPSVSR